MRRSVLAALFGAAACYGALAITEPPGPGLDPDAMSYLGAAESLVRGGDLRIPAAAWKDADSTSPLLHFPPGFSAAMAPLVALRMPAPQAARTVEALAAGATVALGVWIVAGVAGAWAGTVLGVGLLATPALVLQHALVLSEPLCFALLALTLLLMARRPHRPLAYGTAAAVAGLVRYAAVAACGAAVLWALGTKGDQRERLRRAALAAAPALLLHGAWAVRSWLYHGVRRHLAWQGGLGPSARELGATLVAWLAPALHAPLVAVPVALGVAVAAALVLRSAFRVRAPAAAAGPAPTGVVAGALLLAGCYALFVVVSRLFVYDNIPLDDRMLSPVILLVEMAIAVAVGAHWRSWSGAVRLVAAVGIALWLAAGAVATVQTVGDAREGGWGYAGDDWRRSPLVAWLAGPGSAFTIFTNDPAAVWFSTHRPSRWLPATLAPDSVAAFGASFTRGRSALVGLPNEYDALDSPDSLARRLALRRLATFPEGAVWIR